MFSSVLNQRTITSFFSSSDAYAKSPAKSTDKKPSPKDKNKSASSVVAQSEDSSSPIKVNKRKRERIVYSSDEEDDIQAVDSLPAEEIESDKEQVKRFKHFFSSPDKPKKEIKTYSRSKVEKKKIKLSESEDSNEATQDDSKPVDIKPKAEAVLKRIEEDNLEEQEGNPTPKSKSAKTLASYFVGKSSASSETTDTSKESMSPKVACKQSQKTEPSRVEEYDPSKRSYHPIDDACWKKDDKVPYMALCKTLELIENTSARLKMIEILSNFFRSVIVLSPADLAICVYLCLNKLAPDYEGLELGVGDMVLMKAISQTTGKSIESIKSDLKSKGDLGLVAESCRTNQRTMFAPPKLTTRAVYDKLRDVAQMTGHQSTSKKVEKIQSLLVACQRLEARYLIRSLVGKLRIGLAEQSLLAALSQAVTLTPPEQQDWPPTILDASQSISKDEFSKTLEKNTLIIKSTYCECPNYDSIIPVLLKEGICHLSKHCKITPGVPVKPMLAHPTKGVHEILKRFQDCEFTCEFKYDGERAQLHVLDDNSIRIYSRNQENNTSKYPDIISRLSKALKPGVTSCILDTEAVAWDKVNKQILPFQVLSTRKRKDANEAEIKVQVCIFAFDLIYLNGKSLVAKPFKERRRLLHENFLVIEDEFAFVTAKDSNDVDEIAIFLDEAIKNKCEGLMVKTLETNASYEIAKRSHNWLKLKKDYLEGVGDTLDLVVIGGYYGKGKRTGNYGGFLLACYNPEDEEFQTITKIGTGFKDEDLAQHSTYMKQHVISQPKSYYRYDSSQAPDVWFDATQVWEVKCADLSISPVYKAAAGVVDPVKGISIRFPRFIKVRDDKNPEDATSSSQVVEMYENQENVKQSSKSVDEEDLY